MKYIKSYVITQESRWLFNQATKLIPFPIPCIVYIIILFRVKFKTLINWYLKYKFITFTIIYLRNFKSFLVTYSNDALNLILSKKNIIFKHFDFSIFLIRPMYNLRDTLKYMSLITYLRKVIQRKRIFLLEMLTFKFLIDEPMV